MTPGASYYHAIACEHVGYAEILHANYAVSRQEPNKQQASGGYKQPNLWSKQKFAVGGFTAPVLLTAAGTGSEEQHLPYLTNF